MPSAAEMVRKAHRCKTKRAGWIWTWYIFQ